MTMTMTVFADPSHAWLKVTAEQATKLGLEENHLSVYSYKNKGSFFAEEDCDAVVVLRKHRERFGTDPKIKEQYCNGRSKIRSFKSCNM
jgi:hypothetical protein